MPSLWPASFEKEFFGGEEPPKRQKPPWMALLLIMALRTKKRPRASLIASEEPYAPSIMGALSTGSPSGQNEDEFLRMLRGAFEKGEGGFGGSSLGQDKSPLMQESGEAETAELEAAWRDLLREWEGAGMPFGQGAGAPEDPQEEISISGSDIEAEEKPQAIEPEAVIGTSGIASEGKPQAIEPEAVKGGSGIAPEGKPQAIEPKDPISGPVAEGGPAERALPLEPFKETAQPLDTGEDIAGANGGEGSNESAAPLAGVFESIGGISPAKAFMPMPAPWGKRQQASSDPKGLEESASKPLSSPEPVRIPEAIPQTADVFTLGGGDGSIHFVNGKSQALLEEGYGYSTAKAIACLGGWLYTADGQKNSLTAIFAMDRHKKAVIPLGPDITGVVASARQSTIAALGSGGNEIYFIDEKTKSLAHSSKLPGAPVGAVSSQRDGDIFVTFKAPSGYGVASYRVGGVSGVAYRLPQEFVAAKTNPAFDDAKKVLYVPLAEPKAFLRIDTAEKRIIGIAPLPGRPVASVFNSTTGKLYAADEDSGQILVIDASSGVILSSIPIGPNPGFGQIAIDQENKKLYCPSRYYSKAFVIDMATDKAISSWKQPECFYAAVRPLS